MSHQEFELALWVPLEAGNMRGGTDDIFRRWEEQEVSEVEKEQLDKWEKDRESCPQVKRGKNF